MRLHLSVSMLVDADHGALQVYARLVKRWLTTFLQARIVDPADPGRITSQSERDGAAGAAFEPLFDARKPGKEWRTGTALGAQLEPLVNRTQDRTRACTNLRSELAFGLRTTVGFSWQGCVRFVILVY
jgi:hypothetical protein